jgi:hypothetical protein
MLYEKADPSFRVYQEGYDATRRMLELTDISICMACTNNDPEIECIPSVDALPAIWAIVKTVKKHIATVPILILRVP